ncbi:hypothetical protein ACTWPB_27630 [Nocardia sp. IBHARD005]|uniref:hypothetical protein n=1 Tax=Nocardia sp. IBHARD005 TaxID=3457765 RepID=UPI0040597A2E
MKTVLAASSEIWPIQPFLVLAAPLRMTLHPWLMMSILVAPVAARSASASAFTSWAITLFDEVPIPIRPLPSVYEQDRIPVRCGGRSMRREGEGGRRYRGESDGGDAGSTEL